MKGKGSFDKSRNVHHAEISMTFQLNIMEQAIVVDLADPVDGKGQLEKRTHEAELKSCTFGRSRGDLCSES
jgi:hypothetical protein